MASELGTMANKSVAVPLHVFVGLIVPRVRIESYRVFNPLLGILDLLNTFLLS